MCLVIVTFKSLSLITLCITLHNVKIIVYFDKEYRKKDVWRELSEGIFCLTLG